MQREVNRTLYSLTRTYQNISDDFNYEVMVIDNSSTQPLDKNLVETHGKEFRYIYFETHSKSPVEAINYGVNHAKGKYVMIHIDGARILSPGIFNAFYKLRTHYKNPFIYTLSLHLGPKVQNLSMIDGYNQAQEDTLLDSVDWKNNGYELFKISSLAGSSARGFVGPLAESNCFLMPKSSFLNIGGMNPSFQTPGGGLVNLDFFKIACNEENITPIMLLGEGTFHQFHWGIATNTTPDNHPMQKFQLEYKKIYGYHWELDESISPVYYGKLPEHAKKFIFPPS